MKKSKNIQPTFYYSDENLPIKAGGVIFYRIDENMEIYFLMVHNRGKYEDFGGKTEPSDISFEDTVAREVEEESNKIFKKKDILKKIKKIDPIYTKNSKYVVYFVELHDFIDPACFGDKELHDNIYRTVEWVTVYNIKNPSFIKNRLNFRLRFKDFFNKIDNIIIDVNNILEKELEE